MTDETDRRGRAPLAHFGHMGEALPTIERGEGVRVYDADGTAYLDFTSQLYCVNAGHGNERILAAIREQLSAVQYVSPALHSDVRTEYARRLLEVAPASLGDVFFSVSGSDANEAAMQIARHVQGAGTILTRWRSYHGSTYATAGVTGDPAMRAPLERHTPAGGSVKVLPPFDGCDAPFDADSPAALAERAADHLAYVIRNQGPDSVAALLTEVVAGSSGAFTAPPGYFERVREICDEHDVLLIVDEVITGFGRCGEWFGADTESLEPDLLTFAKGATSAYVPLAGVLTSREIGDALRAERPGIGQTFAGSPVACAAGIAALEEYEPLLETVRELESHLAGALAELQAYDVVGDVRGRGFLCAVEFVDPGAGGPVFDPRVEEGDNPIDDVIEAARERGVLVGSGRPGFQVLVAPPLCASADDIDEGVAALDQAIGSVFG